MATLWKPKVAPVLGGASFPCLAVETSSGPHVTPPLRGQGHATLRGDVASVALDVARITRWKGCRTRTAAASGAA